LESRVTSVEADRVEAGPSTGPARRAVTALFGGTLLLGAALLFSVQLMFARMVLPVLGGTSGVWATSMVFFQTALLAAYGYAHWSVRRLGSRRQSLLHVVLLLPPLLLLPAAIPAGWVPPAGTQPELWLLGLLAVAIGPPFVAVASTAPLLQRWYVDTGHRRGADPYFLYRASNLGSIAGLLGYPLVLEPVLSLRSQARLWAAGYVLLVMLVAACALVLWRSREAALPAHPPDPGSEPEPAAAGRTPRRHVLRWIALAFVPSCLLIGVTNVITTDLAPIPLLWVLPLAIYLGTFVVAFSPSRRAARAWLWSRRLLPTLAALGLWVLLSGSTRPVLIYLPLHLVIFGTAALCCHGRLAAERPPATRLTGFYLALSAGGALGGAAAGLLAPVVFDRLLEYPLGLALALLAVPAGRGLPGWARQLTIAATLPALVVLGLVLIGKLTPAGETEHRLDLLLLLAASTAGLLPRRPPVRAVALAAVFLVAGSTFARLDGVIFAGRGFYGTVAVRHTAGDAYHVLMHGTTIHGAQDNARRTTPLTYYSLPGPVGDVIRAARTSGRAGEVAVIGLGAGTVACQARPGDSYTFYEIDPLVARIAADPALFSYLRDCPARTGVVLGDARISLSRRPDARYGVILLDAFSSDVVPVHLLTRQAVRLYQARLRPGGLIAFNITSRYLDLEPVVGRVAGALGLTCRSREDDNADAGQYPLGKFASHWVALAASPADLGPLGADQRWLPCRTGSGRVWTDDYANVLGALDL
jgi:hypothetical protein